MSEVKRLDELADQQLQRLSVRTDYEHILVAALTEAYWAINNEDVPPMTADEWTEAEARAVARFEAALDQAGYVLHLERKP